MSELTSATLRSSSVRSLWWLRCPRTLLRRFSASPPLAKHIRKRIATNGIGLLIGSIGERRHALDIVQGSAECASQARVADARSRLGAQLLQRHLRHFFDRPFV